MYISTSLTPALITPRRVNSKSPVFSLNILECDTIRFGKDEGSSYYLWTLGPPLSPLMVLSSSVRVVVSAQYWVSFSKSGKKRSILRNVCLLPSCLVLFNLKLQNCCDLIATLIWVNFRLSVLFSVPHPMKVNDNLKKNHQKILNQSISCMWLLEVNKLD